MTRPASQTGSSTNQSNHMNQSQFNLSNQFLTLSVTVATAAFSILFFLLLTKRRAEAGAGSLPPVPAFPGLPVVGNLLQLKEKKLYKTFTRMAHKHGPIYSIRTSASTLIVLNSPHLAKEAMVTRFSSISTRKLSNALKILTSDKCMVAANDYNEFHKTVKIHILANFLGANAQFATYRMAPKPGLRIF